PLLDVWFVDARHGFAVGAYGYLLETRDGGGSWEPRELSDADDYHLNQIARGADGTLFIAAEAGQVYRSGDDGGHWERLSTPYAGSFFGVLPLDPRQLLVMGLEGHLYRSEDNGESWQRVPLPTRAILHSGLRLQDGTVLLVGLGGTLLVSRDAGRSFTLQQLADRLGNAAGLELRNGGLLLLGEGGARSLARERFAASAGK
ncbi:MAG TPA: YCF48-related protein, partial [Gammaproteobacteria bacterium]